MLRRWKALAVTTLCAGLVAAGSPAMAHEATGQGPGASQAVERALPAAYQQFLDSVGGSKYVRVEESFMHYVASGPKDAPLLLLLHGSPDNIFAWRAMIPELSQRYRVIAVDLIGFGRSGRPAVNYSWDTETRYLTGFIDALKLADVTLVATDIGALFGFTYARTHPDNVTGLAFWETVTAPIPSYPALAAICGTCTDFFSVPRTNPGALVNNANLARDVYQNSLRTPLGAADLAGYSYFLDTPQQRAVVASIGANMPIAGDPAGNARTAAEFADYLRSSDVAKLVAYGEPGFILPKSVIDAAGYRNTTVADVGPGYHYLAEDTPHRLSQAILTWRDSLAAEDQHDQQGQHHD